MLRRYETIAGGASVGRARFRKVARFVLVALACLAVLTAVSPTALASPSDPKPTPEKLWTTFPLNPTGERLARSRTASRPISPARDQQRNEAGPTTTAPVVGEAVSPALGSDAGGLVFLAGVGHIGTLAFVSVVWVLRTASQPRRDVVTLRAGTASPGPARGGRARRLVVLSDRTPHRSGVPRGLMGSSGVAGGLARVFVVLTGALARKLRRVARRVHRVVWADYTRQVFLSCALAAVLGFLIVHFVG